MLDFDLTELVKGLIEKGREGAYWDFKSKHHRNKAELIHDTLCLANSLTTGKRFLIFGVDDSNYQISGVPLKTGARKQTSFNFSAQIPRNLKGTELRKSPFER